MCRMSILQQDYTLYSVCLWSFMQWLALIDVKFIDIQSMLILFQNKRTQRSFKFRYYLILIRYKIFNEYALALKA